MKPLGRSLLKEKLALLIKWMVQKCVVKPLYFRQFESEFIKNQKELEVYLNGVYSAKNLFHKYLLRMIYLQT